MDKKQLKLNLEIVEKHLSKFFLAMADHWDTSDYNYDRQLHNEITVLETEYKQTYSAEPLYNNCQYHDDVIALREQLQQQLKGKD